MAEPLTVLVDEDCGICTRAGGWLARREGIVVEAIGSATGTRLLRDLTPGERYASVHVVDAAGRRRSGGAALPPIVRRLRGGRGPAALAAQLPGVTKTVYRLVARHRRRLSRLAGLDACATRRPVYGSAHRRRRPGTVPSPIAASVPEGSLTPPSGGSASDWAAVDHDARPGAPGGR